MENFGLFHSETPTDFVPQINTAGPEGLTGLIPPNPASFKASASSEIEQLLTHNLDNTEIPSIRRADSTLPSQDLNLTLAKVSSQSPAISADPLTGQAMDQADSVALNQATKAVYHSLSEFADDKGFTTKTTSAFGDRFNAEKLEDLRHKNFEELPEIEIRSTEELKGANGAFSQDTNTIYLSREYIKQNASHPEAIAGVLLEEAGHSIDSRINSSDAAGDEGAIFSALVQNVKLNGSALQELKAEDDTATIALDGRAVDVEQASNAIKNTNYSRPSSGEYRVATWGSDTNSGVPGTPWRTLEKAIASAPSGSTIVIRRGTYYEGDLGVGKKLTFQPYPHEKVWLDGGQNFERSLVLGENSDNSVVRGLGFRGYTKDALTVGQSPSNVKLEKNVFTENADSGLGIFGTDAIVRRNTFSNNGQQGLHGVGADRAVIEDNLISNNNVGNFATNYRAAGAKFVETDSLILRDNVVKDNNSHGLWVDNSSSNATITGNTVMDNQVNGIFFELSHNATIASNKVVNNAQNGINIYDSSGASVYNNKVSKNAININVGDGPRKNDNWDEVAAGITWETANNVVQNNVLSNADDLVDDGKAYLLSVINNKATANDQMVTSVNNNTYNQPSSGEPESIIRLKVAPEQGGNEVNFQSVKDFALATGYEKQALG